MFKKVAHKAAEGIKEAVKEETQKTTEEIKNDVVSAVKKYLPEILAFAGGLLLVCSAKKPAPGVVKVIVKQV
jgi:hypothetical protein